MLQGNDSPVVCPEDAEALQAFADSPEPDLANREQVSEFVGALSVNLRKMQVSEVEADARRKGYWLALRDIPLCDLRAAFEKIVCNEEFLPMPAVVRKYALQSGSVRRWSKSRARHLAWKSRTQWSEPTQLITEAELAELKAIMPQAWNAAA